MHESTPEAINEAFRLELRALAAVLGRRPTLAEESEISDHYKDAHNRLINDRKAAEAKEAATRARQEKSDRKQA